MTSPSIGAFTRAAALGFAGLMSAFVLAGCAAGATSGPPPSRSQIVTVAALGDSIAYDSPQTCPDCTGFVEGFAQAIAAERGVGYEVTNRSRDDAADAADIREQVRSGYVDNVIGGSDFVIVSVGYNDLPPYGDTSACYAVERGTPEAVVAALRETTPDCIAHQTADSAKELAGVLVGIRERVPEAEIFVITPYNTWAGSSSAVPPQDLQVANETILSALEAWRAAACDVAAAADARCVDLLVPFNGADGTQPAGDLLGPDGIHPSQAGNDLVRDLLLDAAG